MYYYKINYFHIRKNFLSKGYNYQDESIKFEFDTLEKYLKIILADETEYVRKKMLFDMKNNLIKGTCYTSSMIIARNIETSYFVTGLVTYEDGTTHLHSYVEYNGYIIDYTKNLIIKKDVYTKLLKVKELNRINSKDIDYIYNLLLENRIINTNRFIATFGKEIATDLEKNKQLLRKINKNKANFDILF